MHFKIGVEILDVERRCGGDFIGRHGPFWDGAIVVAGL